MKTIRFFFAVLVALTSTGGLTFAGVLNPPTINSPGDTSSPGSVLTTLTPTFAWSSVTGATGYGLYIRDVTTNTLVFDNVGGAKTGNSYALPAGYLIAGHSFRWAVTTFNVSGEGAQSSYRYFQTGQPNLAPYQPAGWSDRIVVQNHSSISPFTDTSGLTTADALYVYFAAANNGTLATPTIFYSDVYLDGVFKGRWNYSAMSPGSYSYGLYQPGSLSAGTHTIRVVVDSTSVIAESSESDNEYTKTITVAAVTPPNLTPYQPSGWSDKIVVSSATGNNTDSNSLTTADTLYVDWAVINNGTGATAGTFYTELYVDGALRATFNTPPPLSAGSYASFADSSIGTLSAGTHTILLKTDSTNAVAENNENDNQYTKTITVGTSTPALAIVTTAFSPATATVGTGYAAQIAVSAAGGQTPYSWSASGLPNGMSINSSSGAPFGTPTVAGTFSVTVTVTDSSIPQKTASKTLALTVSNANAPGNFTVSNYAPYWDSNPPAGPAVRLNWTASNGAVNYDVYRNGILYSSNIAGNTFLNNLGLFGGQVYSYYVIAKNSYGTRQSNTLQVVMPTATPIAALTSVTVTGPTNIAAGGSGSFTATAQYSSGSAQDVTSQSQWSVVGGPNGTHMIGSNLVASSGSASTASVTATYSDTTGTKAGTKNISVSTGFSVSLQSIASSYISGAGDSLNYHVVATASPNGGTGPISASWNLDGISIGPGSTLMLDTNVLASSGGHILKVTTTDGAGLTAQAIANVFLPKAPQLNEQYPQVGANLAHPGKLFAADAASGYLATRDSSKGLLVIIHGMDGRVTTDTTDGNDWMKRMAVAVAANLGAETPNIILYDWQQDTDVTLTTSAVSASALRAFSNEVMPANANFAHRLFAASTAVGAGAGVSAVGLGTGTVTAVNLLALRPVGETHGFALADYIRNEILSGRVSPTAPIHLIGHSAGGFVASNCGLALLNDGTLQASGKMPTKLQVTTLDTPFLRFSQIAFVKNVGGKFERDVSSAIGETVPGVVLVSSYDALESALNSVRRGFQSIVAFFTGNHPAPGFEEAVSYHSGADIEVSGYLDAVAQHIHAHEWYIHTIQTPNSFGEGFYYSPFPGGHSFPGGSQTAVAGFMANGSALAALGAPAAASPVALTGFSTFGTVNATAGTYTLTEQGNAGIYQSLTFPMNVSTVKFRVQFTSPGDGDYVEVNFGDDLSLAVIADGSILRAGPVEFEVPVVVHGGESGQLLFKLNGVGADNAVAVIDNIMITTSDDADGDGLTFAQEIAWGTDPRYADSDADGLRDGDEVNIYHTNPILADSDGDGVSDANEISAGTDPNDNTSLFTVKDIKREVDGSMTIRWNGQPSKTYRVLRSLTPGFESFDVITTKSPGISPLTSYTDPAANLQGVPSAFYRIEVE